MYFWLNHCDENRIEKIPVAAKNIDHPIIKDQMANLGCLLVCTFGNFVTPVLVAAHTVNNLDLGDELENQDYESDSKELSLCSL